MLFQTIFISKYGWSIDFDEKSPRLFSFSLSAKILQLAACWKHQLLSFWEQLRIMKRFGLASLKYVPTINENTKHSIYYHYRLSWFNCCVIFYFCCLIKCSISNECKWTITPSRIFGKWSTVTCVWIVRTHLFISEITNIMDL